MFIKKQKLKEKISLVNYSIKISELQNGINLYENFFILVNKKEINIYDRKCDHAGGKLISKNKGIPTTGVIAFLALVA